MIDGWPTFCDDQRPRSWKSFEAVQVRPAAEGVHRQLGREQPLSLGQVVDAFHDFGYMNDRPKYLFGVGGGTLSRVVWGPGPEAWGWASRRVGDSSQAGPGEHLVPLAERARLVGNSLPRHTAFGEAFDRKPRVQNLPRQASDRMAGAA